MSIGVLGTAFVVVPFLLFEQEVNDLTSRLFASPPSRPALALAIVALLALDIILPVPSSLVSTAAGATLGFLPGTVVSMVGMTLCCQVGYGIGRACGRPLVARMVGAPALEEVAGHVRAGGHWALGALRPIPVLAEASVLLAGLARMSPARFSVITSLANLGVSLVYCALGAAALQIGSPLLAVAGTIVLPVIFIGLMRVIDRDSLITLRGIPSSPRHYGCKGSFG